MDTKTRQQKIFERLHRKVDHTKQVNKTCKDPQEDFNRESYWQEYNLTSNTLDSEMRFNFSL